MKMAAKELGNTPRPAAWSPPLASFSPPVLILATRSFNSLPLKDQMATREGGSE
jgi:hypothetical protein